MSPKKLTRLLALGGLTGMAALHLLPKKYLPLGSRTGPAILIVGLLVAVHRNPLRVLYRDALRMLPEDWKPNRRGQPPVSGSSTCALGIHAPAHRAE